MTRLFLALILALLTIGSAQAVPLVHCRMVNTPTMDLEYYQFVTPEGHRRSGIIEGHSYGDGYYCIKTHTWCDVPTGPMHGLHTVWEWSFPVVTPWGTDSWGAVRLWST